MNRHWRARLGDVVDIKGGGTPSKSVPQFWGGDIPWVSPKDMKPWDITDSEDKITADAISASATNLVPSGSVLLVNRSGILKHTLPVGIARRPVAINQDIKALICGPGAHPDYIAHLVKASEPVILRWVRATTADNFPIESLRNFEIPFPPIEEQRRIAAILDKAEALRQKRKRAIALLDSLTQSIFLEMFGSEIVPTATLGQVTEEFRYGTSEKSGSAGYPTLRIPNVVGGSISLDDLKTVAVGSKDFERLRLRRGDVLFVRTNGNRDYVGRSSVVDERLETASGKPAGDFIFASYLIRARIALDRISPVFLQAYLSGALGRAAMLERCKTSAGQFNINTEGLASIPVPVPGFELQRDFEAKVTAVRDFGANLPNHEAYLNSLFASLQHRAFSGELDTQ